jgi:hypothetical protein
MAAALRSDRMEVALERALAGSPEALIDLLDRSSGLPGPRPNLELARAMGAAIARAGGRGEALVRALEARGDEFLAMVAAHAHAAWWANGKEDAAEALQRLAGDARRLVREGAIDALRAMLAARGDAGVAALAGWTDGYLQAHVALEALADREVLARLGAGAGSEVLARLDEAFALADRSPRSAERLQGVRLLRQSLPAQIAAIAGRFPEALQWLTAQAGAQRPETREVVAEAAAALRKASFPEATAGRIAGALAASAPAPRDPTRIVQGTRRRSKGRR